MRTMLLCLVAVALAACGPATGTATGSPAAAGSPATAAGSAAAAGTGPCGRVAVPPTYQHVIWIWMENHSYGDIIGNTSQAPYINSLAADCGLATNYHNITHPSLPNYLAATSGLARASLPVLSYLDCNPSAVCDTSAAEHLRAGRDVEGVRGIDAVQLRQVELRRIRGAAQPRRRTTRRCPGAPATTSPTPSSPPTWRTTPCPRSRSSPRT